MTKPNCSKRGMSPSASTPASSPPAKAKVASQKGVAAAARVLDRGDQFALQVALHTVELNASGLGPTLQFRVDLGECGPTIYLWIASPEQVQVGPVHDEDASSRRH